MSTILFLARSDRTTMRRYLLVSKALTAEGYEPVFLFLEKSAETIYREEKSRLNLDMEIPLSYFHKISAELSRYGNVPGTPAFTMAEPARTFNAKDGSLKIGDEADIAELARAVGFAREYYFERDLDRHTNLFAVNFRAAEGVFNAFKPAGLVFDLEFVSSTAAIIYAANQLSIPAFSLQHASGYGAEYTNLPPIADHYFAYSESNVDYLMRMGVAEENIFLTGDPDSHGYTDIVKGQKDRSLFKKDLAIDPQSKVLTIALKPCEGPNFPLFQEDNVRLLECAAKVFSNVPGYRILVRRHPCDTQPNDAALEAIFDHSNVDVTFTDVSSPIERFLSASDYFLQFPSAAIVEAIECGVPICVISRDYGAIWPDWNKHHAHREITFDQIENFFEELISGEWPETTDRPEVARQNFLREFSHNHGSKSANEIASRISRNSLGA